MVDSASRVGNVSPVQPQSEDPFVRNQVSVGNKQISAMEELPAGVTINFHPRSTGNRVLLSERAQYRAVVVDLSAAVDCRVSIGAVRVRFGGIRVSFVEDDGHHSTGSFVTLADGSVFNGATHVIGPLTPGMGVSIGRDCLFASGISIRGSSHHGLWDIATGTLLNPEAGIEIGDHVWVGDQVVVLNKARIPHGSVVAARSIVNKQFTEPNSLLAGMPAAVRRTGVAWTLEFPRDNGASPLDGEAAASV